MIDFIIVSITCFSFIFAVYNIGIIDSNGTKLIKNFIVMDLIMITIARINVSIGIPIMFTTSLFFLYMKNKKIFINIMDCIFATIIVFISDGLVASIAIPIIGEEFYTAMEIPRFKIMVHIGMLVIVIIITQVVRFLIRKFKVNPENIKIKNKMTILMIVNICIIAITYYLNAIVAQTYMARNTTMLIYVALMIVYLISMSVITFVVANNMKKEMQYENRKIELENLKEYNSNLEAMYNDMRGFRHDYTNILTAMSGYIEEKNIEGLEEFFYKKIVPLNSEMNRKNNRIGLLQNIHITEIKGLIASKVIRAQELGIDVLVDIVEPVDKINMDIIDLSRTIGILLDNAIEAAIECEKSWIKLTFIQKENFVLLVFINSCVERTPQIYQIFEKGFSTKGDNRGLGLYNLKEIVNKYHTISLDTKADKGEFTQVLQISNS